MKRQIIAVVDDLFFASKIRGTAEQTGVTVAFARHADGITEISRRDSPALIICDLESRRINPIELAKQLKADDRLASIPLIGFFSHVKTELQRQAEDAGFDQILPRSVFTKNLAQILQGQPES